MGVEGMRAERPPFGGTGKMCRCFEWLLLAGVVAVSRTEKVLRSSFIHPRDVTCTCTSAVAVQCNSYSGRLQVL